ncbi:unnamed protein product [Schistocephalus solidus]|uniref:Integrase catalytic domain-containing protein n=1 Tax=Schistocephalus solidus TaxID=70667 RepID=A0A183SUN4_SCHSO|nr:unnamed protein product [Schistocephalus solidus]
MRDCEEWLTGGLRVRLKWLLLNLGTPTPWDLSQVWWHAKERLRPRQPPAPSHASGLLDLVMTPGPVEALDTITIRTAILPFHLRDAVAIPLPNIEASTVVKAFPDRWVAIFDAPSPITTDCGAQFESTLFQSLSFLNSTRIGTAANYPAKAGPSSG